MKTTRRMINPMMMMMFAKKKKTANIGTRRMNSIISSTSGAVGSSASSSSFLSSSSSYYYYSTSLLSLSRRTVVVIPGRGGGGGRRRGTGDHHEKMMMLMENNNNNNNNDKEKTMTLHRSSCSSNTGAIRSSSSISTAESQQLGHDLGVVSNANDSNYTVEVTDDRLAIIISSSDGPASSVSRSSSYHRFDGSWLWMNDPAYIHPTSGQRTRSIMTYYYNNNNNGSSSSSSSICSNDNDDDNGSSSSSSSCWLIRNAKIINIRMDDEDDDDLPPSPPIGSFHPIGGVYNNTNNDNDKTTTTTTSTTTKKIEERERQQRTMLHVEWEQQFGGGGGDHDNMLVQKNEVTSSSSSISSTTTTFSSSMYDVDWLINCSRYNTADSSTEKNTTRRDSIINSDGYINIYKADYNKIIMSSNQEYDDDDDDTRFNVLQALVDHGAVLITNTPSEPTTTSLSTLQQQQEDDESSSTTTTTASNSTTTPYHTTSVGTLSNILSGGISHGQLYGDIFHVISSPDTAENIAYTNVALPPHQDLVYFQSPPGVQYLHCIMNDPNVIIGGESILIDGIEAMNTYRRIIQPSYLFHAFTNVNVTFLKQRYGADMIYRTSHVQLDINNQQDIVALRWAPPFQGPIIGSSMPTTTSASSNIISINDYYLAHATFERMIDNSLSPNIRMLPRDIISDEMEQDLVDYSQHYTWEYRLKPTETLIFNNLRMLHGRRSFTYMNQEQHQEQQKPEKQQQQGRQESSIPHVGRHFIGCYGNFDETLNQYRILRRRKKNLLLSSNNNMMGTSAVTNPNNNNDLYIRPCGNGSSCTW